MNRLKENNIIHFFSDKMPFQIFKKNYHLITSSSHHLIFLLLLFLLSCNTPATTGVIESSSAKTEETNPFIWGNQKIVELENEDIELFLKRYNWEMKKTDTGLRYEITKKGTGKNIGVGETVILEYSTYLLSGEEIYNSNEEGLKRFVVEKSGEIAGLHEAVQLMKKGSEARIIIPSHLAYSASGDGNKIKPYQIIMMKIKMM
jgi:FKBP-type peptidyl-prolyl cis-trans isomerase